MSENNANGWDWFDGADGGSISLDDDSSHDMDLARAYSRCFREGDGQRVLDHLRCVTLGRVLGPNVSDAQLRHTEGQRQLVAQIIAIIEKGRGAK